MAIIKIISCKKWVNNSLQNCYFLATVQGDGFIYFNDDRFYRINIATGNQEIFYIDKQIWVNTNILQDVHYQDFNVTGAANGVYGGGSIAPNASVESAVQWAIDKVSNETITYSQSIRNLKNVNGTSYDCSSFIITAFYAGGIDVAATYTGDMRAGFEALGFTWIPGSYFAAEDCLRGDILLNETYHTQMYIGNGQDVNCGDTPARVCTHSPDNWGGNWDGILRLES